jgi:hypothetical protein
MSRSLDQRQVRITAPRLGTVTLPWWPDEIAWSGMAATYDEQERPGRRPLLLRQSVGLEELRVGTVVRTRDIEGVGGLEATSISGTLTKLREMSRAVKPLTVNLAGRSGQYRITDLGITELEWNADGYPLVAEISLTLLESSEAAVPVGPIRGKGKGSR